MPSRSPILSRDLTPKVETLPDDEILMDFIFRDAMDRNVQVIIFMDDGREHIGRILTHTPRYVLLQLMAATDDGTAVASMIIKREAINAVVFDHIEMDLDTLGGIIGEWGV